MAGFKQTATADSDRKPAQRPGGWQPGGTVLAPCVRRSRTGTFWRGPL